jgi:hypothetical protein
MRVLKVRKCASFFLGHSRLLSSRAIASTAVELILFPDNSSGHLYLLNVMNYH